MWKGFGIGYATWEPKHNIPRAFVERFKEGQLPNPDIFDMDY
jgi:hypothetical protein